MPKRVVRKAVVTRKQKIAAGRTSDETAGSTVSSNDKVEYLKSPVKSENDKKEYRVVRLANGLTVLLISHPDPEVGEEHNQDEGDGDASVEPSSCEPTENGRNYNSRWFEGILEKEKAPYTVSCHMSINVGSFSDPPNCPCTATLSKRAVLAGSEKYPEAYGFVDFVDNCGTIVATDCCERTSYYFKVPEICFVQAIDRFAQCFVRPLLLPMAVLAERDEIEIEQGYIFEFPEYISRKEDLFINLAASNDKNPGKKLLPRYAESLFNEADETVFEEVFKFQQRHYSAHRMTVVMEGQLPLDVLETCARNFLSEIPNNGLPPCDMSHFNYADCFDIPEWRMIYRMRPVSWKDVNKIELNWSMPSHHRYYKSKPLQYIAWIMRHEGKGSLVSYLRQRNLCVAIECDIGNSSLEENSVFSLFNLGLLLTKKGCENLKQVLDTVYSFINLMRREGPQKRIYNELRNTNKAEFKFADCSALEAEAGPRLCEDMHIYESSEYLTGRLFYFKYDPVTIKRCMDLLSPKRANIIVYDRSFKEEIDASGSRNGEAPNQSALYRTQLYSGTEISNEWIRDWQTMEPLPELKFPEPNVFLADDFTLIAAPADPPRYPVKIHSDDFSEVWYKPNAEPRLPECWINFCFVTSLPSESPENACMLELLVKLLAHFTFEDLYPATVAGLRYNIESCDQGLVVQGYGFNQKLPLMLLTIVKSMSECSNHVTQEIFDITKNSLVKTYEDSIRKANQLVEDTTLSILKVVHWTAIEKHAAISDLQLDRFERFLHLFTDRIYIRCLAQGNITSANVLDNVRKSVELFSRGSQPASSMPQPRVNEISPGLQCCRIESFDPTRRVTAVKNCYQFVDKSIRQSVLIEFLILIMNDPLFLGLNDLEKPCKFLSERLDFDVPGYSISKLNYHGSYPDIGITGIEMSLEKVRKSLNELSKHLSRNDLLDARRAFVRIKSRTDEKIADEVSRNWRDIVTGRYSFDRRARELDALRAIDVEDLRDSLIELTLDGPDVRTLSVQVIASKESESASAEPERDFGALEKAEVDENEESKNDYTARYKYKYLADLPEEKGKKRVYITDIKAYKSELNAFPLDDDHDAEELVEDVEKVCET